MCACACVCVCATPFNIHIKLQPHLYKYILKKNAVNTKAPYIICIWHGDLIDRMQFRM